MADAPGPQGPEQAACIATGERLLTLPRQLSGMLCDYLEGQQDRSKPTVKLATPDELAAAFAERGTPVSLGRGCAAPRADGGASDELQEPTDEAHLISSCEAVLEYSVRTSHPHFMNQLYGRVDSSSVAGEWMSTVLNTNSHTFEVAPVNTLLEDAVLRKMATIVGGGFAEAHDGLLVPGGSIANLYAMHLARAAADPDQVRLGANRPGAPRLCCFTTDESHYSYLKAARLIGVGGDNLRLVPCDAQSRMDPAALDAAIVAAKAEGFTPFFCGVTAGTTVFGVFDPFGAVADVCAKHGVWCHVDAAWGGAIMLSAKHRAAYMGGVEKVDSIAWNPHKTMGAALQCSALLTRRVGFLTQVNATRAAYLFQPDKENTELDVGDKTIQCGRKTDAIKLWLQWKALGDEGLRARMDHCMDIAAYWTERMMAAAPEAGEGAWVMAHEPSYINVNFWYVPPSMRPFDIATATQEQRDRLHAVAPAIKAEMQRTGGALVGFQSLRGLPNFFRLVLPNAWSVTYEDVNHILRTFDAAGKAM